MKSNTFRFWPTLFNISTPTGSTAKSQWPLMWNHSNRAALWRRHYKFQSQVKGANSGYESSLCLGERCGHFGLKREKKKHAVYVAAVSLEHLDGTTCSLFHLQFLRHRPPLASNVVSLGEIHFAQFKRKIVWLVNVSKQCLVCAFSTFLQHN